MAPPPTSLQALESFPFLTPREFQWICRALRDRVDAVGGPQSIGWEALELVQQQVGRELVLCFWFLLDLRIFHIRTTGKHRLGNRNMM